MTGSPHQRLADLMEERRLELGLSWKEVATAAGISEATLRAIRNGTSDPAPLTRRGIERALRWAPGSIADVLDGGDPMARDGGSPMDRAEAMMDENERLAAELVERVRRLNRRQREAVEQLVRVLEDSPSPTRDVDRE